MDQSFLIPANETPEQAAMRKRQAVQSALMGGALPQNVSQGLGALADGLVSRQTQQNAAFPQAPGGGTPSFGSSLMNLFSRGNNGGLY